MTPEETKQAAAVMIAWADGKKIQSLDDDTGEYRDVTGPIWDWCDNPNSYRIAPEPMEVEVWARQNGSVATSDMIPQNRPQDYGWTLRRATIHPAKQ